MDMKKPAMAQVRVTEASFRYLVVLQKENRKKYREKCPGTAYKYSPLVSPPPHSAHSLDPHSPGDD